MRKRVNTLLVFSKVPEPGLVKTRLTTLKDGWLDPEAASWLYNCMFFDMMETCCAALDDLESRNSAEDVEDEYRLRVSTAPAENLDAMKRLFEESGEWPRQIEFDFDEGASFDEHYNDAFDKAWKSGSDCILSMGADMPALTKRDVVLGFEALHELDDGEGGIVLAPDQEMGVSSVGWTRDTDFDHTGVFYNQTGLTVLPAYIQKARAQGLRTKYLPAIPDVDTMMDLMHNATLVEALDYCASTGDDVVSPWRTRDALAQLNLLNVRVAPNDLIDPRETIDK
ncbi:MAG: TIGR04282 family arsenosugar biosynthesis glycosyltransferase [Coriobacteriales bacterium]